MTPPKTTPSEALIQDLKHTHSPLAALREQLVSLSHGASGTAADPAVWQATYQAAFAALDAADSERNAWMQLIEPGTEEPGLASIADCVRAAVETLEVAERDRLILDLPTPSPSVWCEQTRLTRNLTQVLRAALRLQSGAVHLAAPELGTGTHLTFVWSSDTNQRAPLSQHSAVQLALLDLDCMGIGFAAAQLPEPQSGLILRLENLMQPEGVCHAAA